MLFWGSFFLDTVLNVVAGAQNERSVLRLAIHAMRTRFLATLAHVNRRAVLGRLLHGHFHSILRNWRCEDPFGIFFRRAPPQNRAGKESLRTATLVAVSMRREQGRQEALYPESAKSVKERCIRVAAIEITISAGV